MNNPNSFPAYNNDLYGKARETVLPAVEMTALINSAIDVVKEQMDPDDNRYQYACESLEETRMACQVQAWGNNALTTRIGLGEIASSGAKTLAEKYGSASLEEELRASANPNASPEAQFWSDAGIEAGRAALSLVLYPEAYEQ